MRIYRRIKLPSQCLLLLFWEQNSNSYLLRMWLCEIHSDWDCILEDYICHFPIMLHGRSDMLIKLLVHAVSILKKSCSVMEVRWPRSNSATVSYWPRYRLPCPTPVTSRCIPSFFWLVKQEIRRCVWYPRWATWLLHKPCIRPSMVEIDFYGYLLISPPFYRLPVEYPLDPLLYVDFTSEMGRNC